MCNVTSHIYPWWYEWGMEWCPRCHTQNPLAPGFLAWNLSCLDKMMTLYVGEVGNLGITEKFHPTLKRYMLLAVIEFYGSSALICKFKQIRRSSGCFWRHSGWQTVWCWGAAHCIIQVPHEWKPAHRISWCGLLEQSISCSDEQSDIAGVYCCSRSDK